MEKVPLEGGGGPTPNGKSFHFFGPSLRLAAAAGGLEHTLVHWCIVIFLFHQFLKQSTCSNCPKEAGSAFIKGAGYYR